ncbi:hypothetical protein B0H16DRAFT_1477174 [Mycena metata]|uniref:Uncharacterized protein n=1 Tax=Mycena metata TaxID=1033252 RepID=A0AAD7HAD5_9AGAR|nr:hypothetical protein B0H16DRAFT_1477174 [Mycena metata]
MWGKIKVQWESDDTSKIDSNRITKGGQIDDDEGCTEENAHAPHPVLPNRRIVVVLVVLGGAGRGGIVAVAGGYQHRRRVDVRSRGGARRGRSRRRGRLAEQGGLGRGRGRAAALQAWLSPRRRVHVRPMSSASALRDGCSTFDILQPCGSLAKSGGGLCFKTRQFGLGASRSRNGVGVSDRRGVEGERPSLAGGPGDSCLTEGTELNGEGAGTGALRDDDAMGAAQDATGVGGGARDEETMGAVPGAARDEGPTTGVTTGPALAALAAAILAAVAGMVQGGELGWVLKAGLRVKVTGSKGGHASWWCKLHIPLLPESEVVPIFERFLLAVGKAVCLIAGYPPARDKRRFMAARGVVRWDAHRKIVERTRAKRGFSDRLFGLSKMEISVEGRRALEESRPAVASAKESNLRFTMSSPKSPQSSKNKTNVLREKGEPYHFTIPVFHAFAHRPQCQILAYDIACQYHTDGEAVERADMGRATSSARMGAGRRMGSQTFKAKL